MKKLSSRRFGVEFEVGSEKIQADIASAIKQVSHRPVVTAMGWKATKDNDYWHLKYDSTCGVLGKHNDHGWEIATFIASGLEDLDHIAKTVDYVASTGVLVNNNCGLHVHADVSDFTSNQMGILMARWLKIEPFLCNLVPPSRIDNYYCKLLFKTKKLDFGKKYKSSELWNVVRPTELKRHENEQKKFTLNTVNFAVALRKKKKTKSTIELRFPEGTLSGATASGWVKFFLNFVETSKKAKMPNNIKPIKTLTGFCRVCGLGSDLSPELSETKSWLSKRYQQFSSKTTIII